MRRVLDPVPDVELLKDSLRRQGALDCVLSNLRKFKDRFLAVKGNFSDVCGAIAKEITPNVVYLDADKSFEMLEISRKYFPGAVLCGDDWTWGEAQGFPIQKAVKLYCERYNCTFQVDRVTWLVESRS